MLLKARPLYFWAESPNAFQRRLKLDFNRRMGVLRYMLQEAFGLLSGPKQLSILIDPLIL